MLVFGRAQPNPPWSVDVAAAYDPATDTWRRLAPLAGPKGNYEGHYSAVWTGKEMLVFGPFDSQAFNPLTNHWRRLPAERGGGAGGLVLWTGHEMIDWGGGCCGDASSGGSAYNPTTNTWRTLAPSPLAPSQQPIGAWTGRELIIFVGGLDPDGKPYPARFARAAAYNPTNNTWRRLAPLPAPRGGATAVWDGREVLVVGGVGAPRGGKPPALAAVGFAYNPATNRWRRLPPMESGREGASVVWTGKRLLVWGGQTARAGSLPVSCAEVPTPCVIAGHGLAYDPAADRWSPLAKAPLLGRLDPAAVWTGHAMIVWGGGTGRPPYQGFTDGALFAPATP
jgi:N-acetylneuraminic acid mutarotase